MTHRAVEYLRSGRPCGPQSQCSCSRRWLSAKLKSNSWTCTSRTSPTIQHTLGEEGYAKFLKTDAEVVAGTETVINHFLPELSNAPEEVAAVAPDYWKPKAMVAANAKVKPATNGKVNAAHTSKMDDKDKQ
jgi:hypothetical protein